MVCVLCSVFCILSQWHVFCIHTCVLRKILSLIGLFLIALPLSAKRHKPVVPDSLQVIEYQVNGVSFRMRRVEGGSFMMGATIDQTDPEIYTDKPAHLVFLSPFYIAETEVTNQLWKAVMPEKESLAPRGYPYNPISYVSYSDCQDFVRALDSLTGMPFRLPTEAEWEFAARGGNKSQHYRFAGGNIPDSIGWINSCSGNWSHPVARKQPNELGLHDMTGNVAEWCEDWYAPYQLGTEPDPCVCDSGEFKVVRGASYDACAANSHISVRRWETPETARGYIGFRVAFSLPNDPMKQPVTEEPALTRKIRIKSKKIHFKLVPAEQPYYISEEISASLWKKIMDVAPPDDVKGIAIRMSRNARARFAELCSREANEALLVASAEQIVLAEQQHIIEPFQPEMSSKDKKRSVRQTQRKRRAADTWSPLTELVGIRLPKPDDPVLLQYKKADDDSRPLRLCIPL